MGTGKEEDVVVGERYKFFLAVQQEVRIMPGFNGTGPEGNGPKTGRGRGRCAGPDRQQQGQGQGARGMGMRRPGQQLDNAAMCGDRRRRRGGRMK